MNSRGMEKAGLVESSSKIVLLLHILAYTYVSGEKTLVFSQSLPTLNLIEKFLKLPDWKKEVKSLASILGGRHTGDWKKNKDYVRIDGAVSAEKRGSLVNQFNNCTGTGAPHVFLLSSTAGSLGINLVSTRPNPPCYVLTTHFASNKKITERSQCRSTLRLSLQSSC